MATATLDKAPDKGLDKKIIDGGENGKVKVDGKMLSNGDADKFLKNSPESFTHDGKVVTKGTPEYQQAKSEIRYKIQGMSDKDAKAMSKRNYNPEGTGARQGQVKNAETDNRVGSRGLNR